MNKKINLSEDEFLENEVNSYEEVFSKLLNQRIIFLHQEIDAKIATTLSALLLSLNEDSNKKISIYINCPGGSVSDGLLCIYDTMQLIEAPIETICLGEACSSAAIILAAGTPGYRYASTYSRMMLHSIQVTELTGSQPQILKEIKEIKKMNNSILEIISTHTGQPVKKIKKDLKEDKFFSASEALKYGIIDKILQPSKEVKLSNVKQ